MKIHCTSLYILLLECTSIVLSISTPNFVHTMRTALKNGIGSFILCPFYECCNDEWIVNNITGLKRELDERLYGQHLVKRAVTSHIHGHVRVQNPLKALALSFHGPTGTGKNHVSRMIAEALYKNGMKSENVLMISVTKEFPHKGEVSRYKDVLRNMIETQIKKCGRSLFIIDEIDKMPAGLIDTITPYLDFHEALDGVDYRKSIFIFLSNTGSTAIMQFMLERLRAGRLREDVKLVDVEKILTKAALNSESREGLWHSELIGKHLITAFLPFLPLERRDVRRCVRDMLIHKGHYPTREAMPEEIVNEILEEMIFFPEREQIFSSSGCKRVAEKVDFVMMH